MAYHAFRDLPQISGLTDHCFCLLPVVPFQTSGDSFHMHFWAFVTLSRLPLSKKKVGESVDKKGCWVLGQSFGVVDRCRQQNSMESAARQLKNPDEVPGKDKNYAKLGKPGAKWAPKGNTKAMGKRQEFEKRMGRKRATTWIAYHLCYFFF